jgi:large subunit ribosomal protein L24
VSSPALQRPYREVSGSRSRLHFVYSILIFMLSVSLSCFTKLVKPQFRIAQWKIDVGDNVYIRSGKWKGGQGEVICVDHARNSLKVKGQVTMKMKDAKGEYVNVERFIHYSNVNLIDPILKVPTRIKTEFGPDGGMIRISKKSGAVIPLPDQLETRRNSFLSVESAKDTLPEVALQQTFHIEQETATMKNVRQKMKKYNYDLN